MSRRATVKWTFTLWSVISLAAGLQLVPAVADAGDQRPGLAGLGHRAREARLSPRAARAFVAPRPVQLATGGRRHVVARRNSAMGDPTRFVSPAYWTGVAMSGCWPWMPQVADTVGQAFHQTTVDMTRGISPNRAGARALLNGHAAGMRMRGLPHRANALRQAAGRL